MNNNKYFCSDKNCDYDKYYLVQAGGSLDLNEISFYTGKPFQRGYGVFSNFGKKYALPFLRYFGKKAFNYGKNVLSDVLKGEEPKSVLRSNLKRSANEAIDDMKTLINQKGKRRKIKKRNKKRKFKKKGRKKIKHHSKKIKKRVKVKNKKKKLSSKNIFDK